MPHPYSSTIPGLVNAIRQLRSTFPGVVNADTLRKWSIASNNEGPVLLVLRFLGLIDEEGKKQTEQAKVFVEHDDDAFAKKFEGLVNAAYAKLFETWGDGAWTLDRNRLIGFFRSEDHTSARVGLQQALTFQALAAIAGHGPPPAAPKTGGAVAKRAPAAKAAVKGVARQTTKAAPQLPQQAPAHHPQIQQPAAQQASGLAALTVRIEINLPVSDDQDVYDKIFRSIRANLLNEQAPD